MRDELWSTARRATDTVATVPAAAVPAARRSFTKGNCFVGGVIAEVKNLNVEMINRLLSVFIFFGSLVGIRPRAKLRLRIVILRDEAGRAVVGEEELTPALALARRLLACEAQTNLVAAGGRLVMTLDDPAPTAALDVSCGRAAWREDIGEAGRYFRRMLAYVAPGLVPGRGGPVTVFIVRRVIDATPAARGCSLGPLTDYVTVDVGAILRPPGAVDAWQPRILASELAHACGLWHVNANDNLMSSGTGTALRWQQRAIVRSSRHVTLF